MLHDRSIYNWYIASSDERWQANERASETGQVGGEGEEAPEMKIVWSRRGTERVHVKETDKESGGRQSK